MRHALIFAVGGVVLLLAIVGLHLGIQRQLQAAAPRTSPPAPTIQPTPGPPTTTPTPQPTVVAIATAVPTRTVPPQPTATPVPPTPTPIPGPVITNDKLGVGVYFSSLPMNVLVTLRPAMLLIQDPDIRSAPGLRTVFPKALIVGRHFVPDGDFSLAHCNDSNENHLAKGIEFADSLARTAVPLKNIVDAWVSDNELTDHSRPQEFACRADFQMGFITTLQNKYGIDAIAGNDASGALEPSDYPKYFAKPISTAKYFGVHAYGKPESRRLNNGQESIFYALRYRMIQAELAKAGVALPQKGFLLTETGVYEGWRGMVPDEAMAQDFIWLEQETAKDSYVKGQFIFGIGPQKRFGQYEILGTTLLEILGRYNAEHAGKP